MKFVSVIYDEKIHIETVENSPTKNWLNQYV